MISFVCFIDLFAVMCSVRWPTGAGGIGRTRVAAFVFRVFPLVLGGGVLAVGRQELTEWDSVCGDGDCGTTFKRGAEGILSALDAGKLPGDDLAGLLRALSERWAFRDAPPSPRASKGGSGSHRPRPRLRCCHRVLPA